MPARKRKTVATKSPEEDDDDGTEDKRPSVHRRSSRIALPSRRVIERMEIGAASKMTLRLTVILPCSSTTTTNRTGGYNENNILWQ